MKIRSFISIFIFCISLLFAEEKHSIAFDSVQMEELVRFASKVSGIPFFYTAGELQMETTFHTSQPMTSSQIVEAVISMLKKHHFTVNERGGYLYIEKGKRSLFGTAEPEAKQLKLDSLLSDDTGVFYVHKLQFTKGNELLTAMKQIGAHGKGKKRAVYDAIDSMQWIESTNSLLYTATEEGNTEILSLIQRLDTKLKQVFIEVLVIETSVKNGTQIGLQWSANGTYEDRLNFSLSNRSNQNLSVSKGLQNLPIGRGFDFGVIGDLIFHKGKTFVTLGSLLDALEKDTESVVVLNQKIITQDSKEAKIFVGDNIPFPGSRIETVGASQQTTSNIEYRDVGVSLKITPLVGEKNIITLDISEEISEATPTHVATSSPVNGIQTTKTNMLTQVHVPDDCFVVLSGMIRNNHTKQRTGAPCLGGLPLIGALTSHHKKEEEKRNVIIFVRPHIVDSKETYQELTDTQVELFRSQVENKPLFDNGVRILHE